MKIAVLGANGQLGLSFKEIKEENQHWIFLERSHLDITNPDSLKTFFESYKPQVIINCAAYTAVDKAESEGSIAKAINETAPGHIAALCKAHDCLLIHYSTDYVYHSKEGKALLETDLTSPKGVYAKTKLAGEQAIIKSGAVYFIIRTSWVYSPFKNNFVKTMLRLFAIKDELSIVDDQIGAPSYTFDIVTASLELINQWHDRSVKGNQVFNFANDGKISWYDFASAIKDLTNASVILHAIPSEEYPTPAARPKWSLMDLSKIKTQLSLPTMLWKDSLKECLSRLDNIQK